MVVALESLPRLNAEQLRELAGDLIAKIAHQSQQHGQAIADKDQELQRLGGEIKYRQAKIEQFTHEMAVLKRWKFGRSREHLDAGQARLLDETIDADIAVIEQELHNLTPAAKPALDTCQQSKRAALPPELPRVEMHHEPESTLCTTAGCCCSLKRIGEDVAEKLDYTPGVFTVERHIRGKWACAKCQTLQQAPVPAQIIDKGIPTAGLLAQVLVGKYADHLPLRRQETIFARPVPALLLLAPRWVHGWACAGFNCSRWSMP